MADKFEAFTDEELAQLGEKGEGEQLEDDDLPQDTDDEEEGQQEEEGKDEDAEESEGDEEEVETDDDGRPLKKESKVNIGALHEERAERKRYQALASELQDRYARLETRMEMLLTGLEQTAPQKEEEIPDKNTDPLGYIEYMEKRIQKLEGKTEETDKKSKEQTEQQQQQERLNEALRIGNTMAAEVRNKDPETYDAALQFTVTRRAAELRALGTSEADIGIKINQELQAGMINALQRKLNPGEFLLQYAKAQGFTGKKASGNKSVEEIAEAKSKNKSLGQGSAPGSTPGKSMARAVAEMNDEQFAAWYAKNLKGGKNKEFANLFKE